MNVLALALAFGVSALTLALLARRPDLAPHDLPNERSLHERPVPRAGGWAIWAGWAAAALVADPPPGLAGAPFDALCASLAVLFVVSLVDDFRGVAPAWRMLAQIGCAAAVTLTLAAPGDGGLLRFAAIAFIIVAATNIFNFMDGSDGLAGAMAAIGFASLAAGATLAGASSVTLLALTCAVLPFLARNFPPARIFMGDAGAVPLGFLAATASAAGVFAGAWPAWFPVLVFLPFLADAAITLARRIARGDRVWDAHRSHYYQRLVTLGAGHRGTLAVYGTLMVGCGSTAVACFAWREAAGPVALAAWVAIVALVFAGIDYHGRKRA